MHLAFVLGVYDAVFTVEERNMYKVSVSESPEFGCGIYRVFGTRESLGFGYDIYRVSAHVNLPDSDVVFTEYRSRRISRIRTRYRCK